MDPLAQLKDIHLPGNVHNYPIAPGWWLIALLLLALTIFSVIKLRSFLRTRKAKKLALNQLNNANDNSTVVTILKWTLLQYFPRQHVAQLSGDNLSAFLVSTLPEKQRDIFEQLSANSFSNVYQKQVSQDITDFKQAVTLWVNQALPPKKDLAIINNNAGINVPKPLIEKSSNEMLTTEATKIGGAQS